MSWHNTKCTIFFSSSHARNEVIFSVLMLDKNTKRWFCLKKFLNATALAAADASGNVGFVVLNFDEIKYWKLFILTAFDRKTEATCHRFPCIFSIHFSTQGNSGRGAIKYLLLASPKVRFLLQKLVKGKHLLPVTFVWIYLKLR